MVLLFHHTSGACTFQCVVQASRAAVASYMYRINVLKLTKKFIKIVICMYNDFNSN